MGQMWMKKERERVKTYYTPTDLLSEKDKCKRREKNRINAKQFYFSKKNKNGDDGVSGDGDQTSSGDAETAVVEEHDDGVSSTVRNENLLTVKMPFNTSASTSYAKKGPKKRQSRALKKSNQRIETLEDQNENLRRKLKTAHKRLNRFEAMKQKGASTPRSKADAILKGAGLKPNDVPDVRKQLVYAECMSEEVRVSVSKSEKPKEQAKSHTFGKVLKKYRMRSHLQKITFLERRKALKNNSTKKKIVRSRAERIKGDVENFLNRDDNSRVLPGKGDSVKVGTDKKQKRILNDYLGNLHLKFVSEVDYKISRASFCRLRPKEVSLVNFTSRSVCLCSKHQNMGFKLRALKNMNVCTNTSPDSFVDMYKDVPSQFECVLSNITQSKVKFQQWKKVKQPNGKERMRIVDIELPREEFVCALRKEFGQFISHVDRVRKQYRSVKAMKENLPKNHVLVQMDFSENYTCQTIEEVQSAYWNSSMVTLHPTIVYFNEADDTLGHKSMVFVSEVLHHNASMVSAIIEKSVKRIKMLVPDLKFVHFWTDSPSSQYRNKSIFDMMCNFENEYGCKATWHYFESGHGKSACDGVGGTAMQTWQ